MESQISYIFFDLDNNENDLINIFFSNDIKSNILNRALPESSTEMFEFNNLIKECRFSYVFGNFEEPILDKGCDGTEVENLKETVAEMAVDRYYELLLNEYIYTKNYKPKYFNKLHSEAKKYLKDNLKGKKYDDVQFSHCSFLLAAMVSFKDYIDNCLPKEVSEDFNKYFQAFNKTVLQMCCTPLYKNIDNSTALSEFAAFLTLQIENGSIIDKSLGIDSEIGWINRKKNKIYLKNTSGNNFYDKFIKYLTDRNENFDLSKQAFVRDVLAKNGVINARTTSKKTKVQRYDYERKILEGHDKFRVLVLNCDSLNIQ